MSGRKMAVNFNCSNKNLKIIFEHLKMSFFLNTSAKKGGVCLMVRLEFVGLVVCVSPLLTKRQTDNNDNMSAVLARDNVQISIAA